ncbi:uncharacterized protein LOC143532268 [Bidens hawaiensis]|uniref:uncharacterized protein LOC143532268 n=1 Tax=Bidens hawaiensis TaxID=980011 RepID=UPI00404B710C
MTCLLHSQELAHILEVKARHTRDGGHMTKKYDSLVLGWILGTMNDQLLETFTCYSSVQLLWSRLESKYNSPETNIGSPIVDSVGFTFGIESVSDVPEMESTDSNRLKKELYEAAVEGCWLKAKSILKVHKSAATEAITANGNTILHLAVQMGHNYFVEKLLELLKDGEDIEKKNIKGRTALHIAGMVGNEHAAQLLVNKRKQLLLILDHDGRSPAGCAFTNSKINVSAYLYKSLLSSDLSGYPENYQQNAIYPTIYTKQYDLAGKMLNKFPEVAMKYGIILKAVTISFPTDLGFTESIIYPSFNNVLEKTVVRGSLLFHLKFLDKCADDISRVMKICNDMCYSLLGRTSVILLGEYGFFMLLQS